MYVGEKVIIEPTHSARAAGVNFSHSVTSVLCAFFLDIKAILHCVDALREDLGGYGFHGNSA